MTRRCPSSSTNQHEAPIFVSGLRLIILMEQSVAAYPQTQAGDVLALCRVGTRYKECQRSLLWIFSKVRVSFWPCGLKAPYDRTRDYERDPFWKICCCCREIDRSRLPARVA